MKYVIRVIAPYKPGQEYPKSWQRTNNGWEVICSNGYSYSDINSAFRTTVDRNAIYTDGTYYEVEEAK